jgi:hypothetical protein
MKIVFEPKPYRIVKGAMLLLAVVLVAYVAYAATTLTINNSGTVVNVSANLFASLGQTPTTVCSGTTTPAYTDTGLSITSWSVTVGQSQSQYACIENTGSSAHVLGITGAGFPAGVTFSSPQNGASIAGSGFLLVQFTLTASSAATVGSFTGATITIA